MKTYTHTLNGEECSIHFLERRDEAHHFETFLANGDKFLGLDTETTGLNIYSPGFRVRLVQFGNRTTAYVLPADTFRDVIVKALNQQRYFVVHNASFDLQVIERYFGVTIESLAPRVFDTHILAHLIDPRTEHEGGVGLKLKTLSAYYIDPSAPDTQDGLNAVFRSLGLTKATGWAGIPINHPTYVLYAGLDPIFAARLFSVLAHKVHEAGLSELSTFEHHLQNLIMLMERRGLLVDVPYTEQLGIDLEREANHYNSIAAKLGVENINSTRQVSAVLMDMGEVLTERTPSGLWKVDKGVLLPLADLDPDWNRLEVREPNPVADAVLRAGRASKWGTSYVEPFLSLKDTNNRIHPNIRSLQARTARMSVANPPLQQLPSGDWKVRRAIVADEGHTMIAADYSQVEMRVLAALSGDKNMCDAIRSGMDIHDAVATSMYGPGFTKHQRRLAKNTGFGEVYGGGATTLARQAGVAISVAKEAKAIFAKNYPGIKRYGKRLQERADYGKRAVVTPSGRVLPLDRDRTYAATNYVVQSTSRDILAQAIVDLHEAGLGEYLLMPIHDEILAQAPREDAEDVIKEIAKVMGGEFGGLPIIAEGEVYGSSWGAGYGAPESI